MGRSQNERADFNQKADHPFLPSEFGDRRPNSIFFRPRSHASQFPRASRPGSSVSFRVSSHTNSFRTVDNFPTMLFGPLGPSLAPYVRSSRTLSKWLKPVANWYANLSGYRRVGLVYDDLRAYPISPSPLQTPRTTRFHHAGLSSTECSLLSFPVVEERPDVQRVRVGFFKRFL